MLGFKQFIKEYVVYQSPDGSERITMSTRPFKKVYVKTNTSRAKSPTTLYKVSKPRKAGKPK